MSAALLLITHEHIAHNLLTTAHDILNKTIDNATVIEVPMDASTENIKAQADEQLSKLATENGLLILTDLVGSTPFNVASQIKNEHEDAVLISGLNLPMLLKLSNYRDLPLIELSNKAIIGGKSGIDTHE